MTGVEFHTLAEASDAAWLRGACAVIEREYLAGQRVLVWLEEPATLSAFDNLLWTFADRAFVPHAPLNLTDPDPETPVQLCAEPALPPEILANFQVLVPLRREASAINLKFARVLEIVDGDETRRNAARTRFRFYRDQGLSPLHCELAPRTA
jgi:DNA polymerase III subunit chi